MITLKNISFNYPGDPFILNIPSLEIMSGKSVSVYGPSGSGKSTLLKLIAGEISLYAGDISINNRSISNLSENELRKIRMSSFGIVSQKPNLIKWMTVKDNILLVPGLSFSKVNLVERLDCLTEALEIQSLLHKNAGEISTGEQFRASIARALIGSPEIVLADEPTSSLDEKLREKTLQLIIDECKKSNTTLVIVSHQSHEIECTDSKLSSIDWNLV